MQQVREQALLVPRPSVRARALAHRREGGSLSQSVKALLYSNPRLNRRSGRDRRATKRFHTEVVCEETTSRGSRNYRLTWDLSTFGMSTQFGTRYATGTRVELLLHLPDDASGPVPMTAEVVGVNDDSGGMRLAFRNPPLAAIKRIHRFLFAARAANA